MIPFGDTNGNPWPGFTVTGYTGAVTGEHIFTWQRPLRSAVEKVRVAVKRRSRWDESLAWGAPVRTVHDDQIRGFRARSRTCSGASRWRAVLQ